MTWEYTARVPVLRDNLPVCIHVDKRLFSYVSFNGKKDALWIILARKRVYSCPFFVKNLFCLIVPFANKSHRINLFLVSSVTMFFFGQ